MTSEEFRVSVIIPTYNRATLLAETLDSVAAQTLAPCEVIVVDDGSNDDTEAVVQQRRDVRYLRQDNRGVAAARNYGIRHARGEWVACLDSDDLWTPERIESDRRAHERHPSARVLCGGYRRMSSGRLGRPVHPPDAGERYLEALATRNSLCASGVTVYRDALLETSGFREDRELGPSADWELWVRLAARYELACTHAADLLVREHPDNMMHDPRRMERAMHLAVESFLVDDVAGPRLAHIADRVRSRAHLYAAIGYYGCSDTASARSRLRLARELDPSVVLEPVWLYTRARALLGDRLSSQLRRVKQRMSGMVSSPRVPT